MQRLKWRLTQMLQGHLQKLSNKITRCQSVKEALKRVVFRSRQNDCSEVLALEDGSGRVFHTRAAATGKARSPRVERRVDGTISVDVAASMLICYYNDEIENLARTINKHRKVNKQKKSSKNTKLLRQQRSPCSYNIQCESKNPSLRTYGNFSKTVENFSTKFYTPITCCYLR